MDQPEPLAGLWWRFDSYEFRDGYIRPAKGARGSWYDPWRVYREARASRKDAPAPYQELLPLARSVRFRLFAGTFEPEPEEVERVLEWCSRWGLLGVLLNRVHQVTQREGDGAEGQRRMLRTAFGWTVESVLVLEDGRPGPVVPGALVRDMDDFNVTMQPVSAWAEFFPNVPREEAESYRYPTPLTERFWHEYAEPIEDFLLAAEALAEALERLASPKESEAKDGLRALTALADDVRMALVPVDGGFRLTWFASSLLGYLAAMAMLDLSSTHRVLRCENCGRVFVAGAPRARYCSPRCRHTAQMRAYRHRQYRARELHDQGLPLEDIARRVGSDVETVRGWLEEED